MAGIPTLTDPVPGSITHPKASPVVQDRIAGPDYSDVTTAVAPPSILARDEEALSELEAARTGQTPQDIADAQKTVGTGSHFHELSGCYYLQPGVLSKLVVFSDKLFANITTSSEDQKDTLISLLSTQGEITSFKGGWRHNF